MTTHESQPCSACGTASNVDASPRFCPHCGQARRFRPFASDTYREETVMTPHLPASLLLEEKATAETRELPRARPNPPRKRVAPVSPSRAATVPAARALAESQQIKRYPTTQRLYKVKPQPRQQGPRAQSPWPYLAVGACVAAGLFGALVALG